jgi:acetophenone carboxylase
MDRKEVFKWFTRPSPLTPLEQEWMDKIDPIDMEIFFNKINMICYSGKEVMVKVGCTPAMTGTDLNTAIYTANGDTAVSGQGVYLHALSGIGPIKYFKEFFSESVGIREGDILFISDPFIMGTHVNDQIMATPVFVDGHLIAFAGCGAHEIEVGAFEVGMPIGSTNRYMDGMFCTTIKIGENWKLRDDLVTGLANMTRDQQNWVLDVKAKYAALVYMHGELKKLGEEKGAAYVAGGLRRLIRDAEEAAKKKVARYNDGTYRSVIFTDSVGAETALQRVCVTLKKKGDTITLDYTGTSPQGPGSMNSYAFCMPASLVTYLLPYLFYDLPTSMGVLSAFEEYIYPENSFINTQPNASVSHAIVVIIALAACYVPAFAKMVFDSPDRETIAAPQAWTVDIFQCIAMNQRGLMNAGGNMDPNALGQGGRVNEDGVHSMNPSWATLCDCLETEWYEKDMPYLYFFRKHAVDSGGAGKFRGGSGIESCWAAHNVSHGLTTNLGAGTKVPNPIGIFGGYSAQHGPSVLIMGSNSKEILAHADTFPQSRRELVEKFKDKVTIGPKYVRQRPFSNGDIYTAENPGGGGYGDVLERGPELVMNDLRINVISEWTAKNVYRVAYDKDVLVLDKKKTEELRAAEKANRAKRGKRYEDFEKEWLKLKPKDEILKYFGPWPY